MWGCVDFHTTFPTPSFTRSTQSYTILHPFHTIPYQFHTWKCSFPYKPSPAALLHICETWGILASECIMVGDSVKDDIVCGNRAGAVTVLLDYEGKDGWMREQLEGEQQPTHIVSAGHSWTHSWATLPRWVASTCLNGLMKPIVKLYRLAPGVVVYPSASPPPSCTSCPPSPGALPQGHHDAPAAILSAGAGPQSV